MKMKKCKYCKTEIDSKAKICPQCHKRQTNVVLRGIQIFFGFILFFAGLGVIYSSIDNVDDNEKCYITLEEFNNIENGMSYEQVKNIVGCDGTIVSDTQVSGFKMTIYSWYGKDGISNANINIKDNKLINKTQIGLK